MLDGERIRVVITDDDALFREILVGMLSTNGAFEVTQAANGDELVEILSNQAIDCIVLDYDLGSENGFSIKQNLSERFAVVPPVVMLTGDGREGTVIKAMRMGFGDYVPKRGLQPQDLFRAITGVIEKERDEARGKSDLKRLAASARHDMVTGAIARPQLDEHLASLAELSTDARADYALVLVECVQLHEIREKFGLKAADRALREWARRLHETIRATDIWGRFGSDVFLVIAKVNSDPSLLQSLCERMAEHVAIQLDLDLGRMALSARIGAGQCGLARDGEAATPADLTAPARRALEKARATGAPLEISLAPVASAGSSPAPKPGAGSGEPAPVAAPAADSLRASNRRRDQRHRVFKPAQILLLGSSGSINCMVRNLSSSGAGLRTEAPFAVPKAFDLLISGSGTKRRARVLWQNGCDLGIEFSNN